MQPIWSIASFPKGCKMIDYSSSPKIEIENVDTPLTLFGLRLNHLLVMLWLFLAPMPIFGIGVSAILLPVWYVFF